ncbi:hypothetical protein ACEQPO_30485 [Bacillus sp. SL00103]
MRFYEKAKAEGLDIPNEVMLYIANQTTATFVNWRVLDSCRCLLFFN